ncbi:MAG: ATP-dependent helicase [Deltaproteobacteria bacterium]|nr:MAG: ATP-dependent helicase [Deltaproteobacteria bacterium]
MTTPYHARFFANELTHQGGEGVERLSRSLFDACVDLNPHQIEAALFALRSPISKGILLADEVGLGKTIEAGLAICQSWAERHRCILVICPASLRKQWALELEEKFHLSTLVLDAKTYREQIRNGNPNPFTNDRIVICSLHFASSRAAEIKPIQWDLVVIDEAHKLRNAYRQSNRMGQNIRWALEDRRKVLLTATPLQNSLLELYGLSTIIDERIFGDLPSYRTQYVNVGGNLQELRGRLESFCMRTLRSQVLEYIQYTERRLITRPFKPTDQEHKLYEAVSDFLKRDGTYALPYQQRHLTALIVRKLLASSSRAVAGTLEVMRDRLIAMCDQVKTEATLAERIIEDEEIEDDLLDELLNGESDEGPVEIASEPEKIVKIDKQKLGAEIEELARYIQWARSIGIDTKTRALLNALEIGFSEMEKTDANQKAIIFTESRRTQQFLQDFLESNGYAGEVVTFNGTNREPESTRIYKQWLEVNKESGRVSGSRPIDVRTAIIEHFRDNASIMIATEAAAEGINLQFCSLVINFDLPWNPQRIEQRIGRCHRYGQKHDVVVINFLNERNAADLRVYELLNEKFNLFTGVFGASDEVLGGIESGVDFERRVLDIYQQCRTQEEIECAFEALRAELDEIIASRIQETRQILLEHFDEDVHARLRINLTGAQEQLDRVGRMFWTLTRFILDGKAAFDDQVLSFCLTDPPMPSVHSGTYHMISKGRKNVPGEFLYRLGHPLGEFVIQVGKDYPTPVAKVMFDISGHQAKISVVENLKGKSGWLILQRLIIDSFEREEYLLFSGFEDDGNSLDQETCEKFFHCRGKVLSALEVPEGERRQLAADADRHAKATISKSLERNNHHFNEARGQLEKWADDMVLATEKELHDTKEQIKALNRQARQATTVEEQHQLQGKIKDLEKKKRRQRQRIFDVEDEIMEKRDSLIDALEKRMQQRTESVPLFTVRWKVT